MVAHIFNPSDGILSTSPDTKPKIEFLQSSEELREIHFVSRNNLVEIEKGLASNLHSLQCFRSRRKVGKSGGENSKIEFTAKFRRNCRKFILYLSCNNLVEIEEGLASNLQCNVVFRAGAVGKSENPGD